MEFRLLYEGELLPSGGSNKRASEKHKLLLLPTERDVKPNDALVVIHVKLNHKNARAFDNWFG